jgi:hypothetical protein
MKRPMSSRCCGTSLIHQSSRFVRGLLAASYIPALRAAAVDPNQALRHE